MPTQPTITVMIDAGHGGHDSGCVSYSGDLLEKDVVLSVANELRLFLRAAGCSVLMTRQDDSFVGLEDRARRANAAGVDLFVSVHCNAANRKAHGVETYHFPLSRAGKQVATRIQDELKVGRVDRGVKSANFAVLRLTRMPAVLVELEFLDSKEGEAWLVDRQSRVEMARRIAVGIGRGLGTCGMLEKIYKFWLQGGANNEQ